jgi:hypothetical protein
MKAKFLLAFTLVMALVIGTANANPIHFKGNKTATVQNFSKDGNLKQPGKARHHHHYRRHHLHRHHMMKH